MGCFSQVEAFLQPPLSLLAQIPPTAALAVFFVLAGTGQKMYLYMIGFGILPALAQTVYLAVKDFPEELLHKSYTLGASHLEVICSIILRQVLPRLIDALRLAIGPALVYLIAAEMVVGDVGFGYRIRLQSKLLNMSVVYPYLALLAAFGFTMDFLLRRLQGALCPWYLQGRE
jgi:NitT/TauT family transport system permease protein